MGASDSLFEAEQAIRSDMQCETQLYESEDDPALLLVLAVLRAVRMEPGRDRAPDQPSYLSARWTTSSRSPAANRSV